MAERRSLPVREWLNRIHKVIKASQQTATQTSFASEPVAFTGSTVCICCTRVTGAFLTASCHDLESCLSGTLCLQVHKGLNLLMQNTCLQHCLLSDKRNIQYKHCRAPQQSWQLLRVTSDTRQEQELCGQARLRSAT